MGRGSRYAQTTEPQMPAGVQTLSTALGLTLRDEQLCLQGIARAAADAGLARDGVVVSGAQVLDDGLEVTLPGVGQVPRWVGTFLARIYGDQAQVSELDTTQRDFLRALARGV